jgi:hypothetical protein
VYGIAINQGGTTGVILVLDSNSVGDGFFVFPDKKKERYL